jgi:hypothetical protein
MELAGKTERLKLFKKTLLLLLTESKWSWLGNSRQGRTEFENDKRMLEATIADLSAQ